MGQQMIREMQALFGEDFWLHTVIGVSHWAFDANSVAQRNFTGKTEDKLMAEWNELLQSKFHITGELDGVFIDSFSQQPWNLPDPLQQEAFQRETEKLWTFLQEHDVFPFRTIGDVLEENAEQRKEIKWLNDVITNNITELTNQITSLSSTHTDDVNGLRDEISEVVSPPLGTILAWVTRPSTDADRVDLPEGWVRCNGELIAGPSIWAGFMTPDLNGEKKFLRGGSDSSELTMEDEKTRLPDHSHDSTSSATATADPHSHSFVESLYYCESKGRGDGDRSVCYDRTSTTSNTTVHVEVDVNVAVKKVSQHESFDDETRPTNMNVIYMMRVF